MSIFLAYRGFSIDEDKHLPLSFCLVHSIVVTLVSAQIQHSSEHPLTNSVSLSELMAANLTHPSISAYCFYDMFVRNKSSATSIA